LSGFVPAAALPGDLLAEPNLFSLFIGAPGSFFNGQQPAAALTADLTEDPEEEDVRTILRSPVVILPSSERLVCRCGECPSLPVLKDAHDPVDAVE
jgi:hypothetical protein